MIPHNVCTFGVNEIRKNNLHKYKYEILKRCTNIVYWLFANSVNTIDHKNKAGQ